LDTSVNCEKSEKLLEVPRLWFFFRGNERMTRSFYTDCSKNSHVALSIIALISKPWGVVCTHTDVRAFVTNRLRGNPRSKRGEIMSTKKKFMAAGVVVALSMGSVGIAQASARTTHFASKSKIHFASSTMPAMGQINPVTSVLATLVRAGTITQAQSDAITSALAVAEATRPTIGGGVGGSGSDDAAEGPDNDGPDMGGMGGVGFNLTQDLSIITTTLGITQVQLEADIMAGQSLATIAGAKTAALIAALVAGETVNINAKVTAGVLTQAQATTLIAGLTAEVTTAVNAAPVMGGMGQYGEHGNGHHGKHEKGEGQGQGLGLGLQLNNSDSGDDN
jgi:hypothetical protein